MKLLKAILFLITINATAQAELGIGLASIKFNDKTVLKLYVDPYDREPKHIIEFYNDEIEGTTIRDAETQEEWLKPEVFSIEYGQLIFRCKSESRFWAEIIVNNETGETLWLKKTKTTILSTWDIFLKEMFMVSRNSFQQEIRMQPNDTAQEITFDGEECFQVKAMKGDWIQIFTADHCDEVGNRLKSGWIKWKEGEKLLIEYFLST